MKRDKLTALCLSGALLLSLGACVSAQPLPSAIPSASAAPSAVAGADVVTALDNQNCLVRVLKVNPKAKNGCTVDVELTNRTKKPVLFGLRYAAVNGVQTAPPFSAEVPGGETEKAVITLKDEVLEYYGITDRKSVV